MIEHRPTPPGKRHALRPVARALALEPRLLFDGAGAVAAADHFDAADHAAEAHKQDTQPAADARPSEAGEKAPGTLLVIDARVADWQSLLADLPANVTVRVVQADESGLKAVGTELAGG
ncbi:MAG: LEPR-XLL domain-containing protein [Rhodocyclaceae bacterium]|nr:LEPR-XLL domain-containing protein [Rhodocyclaceae bacterium]